MTTKQQARKAIAKRFGSKQDRLDSWPAYLGNEDGTVGGSRAGYVYVRYPSVDSAAIEVYNGGVPEVAGLRVMVGYRAERPNEIQALGVADVRIDAAVVSPIQQTLKAHAPQHAYGGGDQVYINWRQITPLGVFPMNPASLSVQVQPGYIPRPGADVAVSYQLVDLTSHVPASGARYALISFNSAGTVVVTDGAINGGGTGALTNADIPDTPAGNWRSAAVMLYAGQAAVVENTTEIDIYDLRFPEETTAGTIYPSSMPLTEAHILVGNASDIATDVAMSGDATIANTGALTLANSGVAAATYGDATHVAQVAVDVKGRITSAANVDITFPAAGQYRQFTYAVSGGDFSFIIDADGKPVMALQDLE